MTWRLVDDGDNGRTYVLVVAAGDDAIEALQGLARDEALSAAQLTGVGAFAEQRSDGLTVPRRSTTESPLKSNAKCFRF